MIIRPALPPDAPLIERINQMTERVRLVEMTGALPIEATLSTSEATNAPHAASHATEGTHTRKD